MKLLLFCISGLVGQQIDSFDEFIRYTIQELVYDTGEITMTPEDQFIIGQDVAQVRFTCYQNILKSLFIYFLCFFVLRNVAVEDISP